MLMSDVGSPLWNHERDENRERDRLSFNRLGECHFLKTSRRIIGFSSRGKMLRRCKDEVTKSRRNPQNGRR